MCCDGTVTDSDVDPVTLRLVAEQLATEAAEFVRRRRREVFGDGPGAHQVGPAVRSKSTPTDPVTVVDTETERLLRERLADLRPRDRVIGEEEGGPTDTDGGRPTWVLDPIDGTVNFLYGIESYAVSVGAQVGGESVAGAVADVAAGAVYSAARGHGAWVRHAGSAPTRLRCNAVTDLSMALVGTGFSYDPDRRQRQAQLLARLLPNIRDVRRTGSCALDLCMVASGRLDGYYEAGVHVWDWAAGVVIAAEAGAWVRTPAQPGDDAGLVLAAVPGIADQLDDALSRFSAD